MLRDITRSQTTLNGLRDLVLEGAFVAGQHLKETEITERLNVSRTPVREALAALAKEGLLVYEPNCGYRVRAFSLDDLLAAFDVRATLEGMACRLIAERGLSSKGAEALEECMVEGRAILAAPEFDHDIASRWNDMNKIFHTVLIEESGNSYLGRSIPETLRFPILYDETGKLHSLEEVRLLYGREVVERSLLEHARILAAVRERQGSRADGLMREHIFLNREALRENFTTAYSPKAKKPL
jgi:GntR family transcriptional regulator of vanillate catabolism